MKKSLKNTVLLLTVLLMVAVTFSACSLFGGGSDTPDPDGKPTPTPTPTPTPKPDDTVLDATSGLRYSLKGDSYEVVGIGTALIADIVIPNALSDGKPVTSIAVGAFENCTTMESIVVSDNIVKISNEAFKNCTNLRSVHISGGVTSIGMDAFRGCNELAEIVVDDDNANYTSRDNVLYNKALTSLIKYPAQNDYIEFFTIPDSVTEIGVRAFEKCAWLAAVVIKETVTNIGYQAFYDCGALEIHCVYKESAAPVNWDSEWVQKKGTSFVSTIDWEFSTNEFTITYVTGDGGTVIAPVVQYEDFEITAPAAPARDGFRFEGWYYGANGADGKVVYPHKVTRDRSIYAKWVKLVKINFSTGTGGTVIPEVEQDEGKTVAKPANPTRANYRFDRWVTTDGGTAEFDFTQLINDHTTVYAKWIMQCTVTFNTQQTAVANWTTPVADVGTTVARPADPAMDSQKFKGWYADAACTAGNEVTFPITLSEISTIVYAKWVPSYNVTFNLNYTGAPTAPKIQQEEGYGITSDMLDAKGLAISGANMPIRAGYRFDGWFEESACTTAVDFNTYRVTQDDTVYAKWVQRFVIDFVLDTDDYEDYNYERDTGSTITLRDTVITKTGHEFAGWYTTPNYVESSAITFPYVLNRDVTVYAKWTVKKFRVTFFTSVTEAGQTTISGDKLTIEGGNTYIELDYGSKLYDSDVSATSPTKKYHFDGWYTKNVGETGAERVFLTDADHEWTIPAEDTYLYAYWTEQFAFNFYPLDGSGDMITEYFIKNSTLTPETTSVPVPTRHGYQFDGWYTADGTATGNWGTKLASVTVTAGGNYYAKWNKDKFTITLNYDYTGCPAAVTEQYEYESELIRPSDLKRDGYIFDKWMTTSQGTTPVAFPWTIDGAATFYATWIPIVVATAEDLNFTSHNATELTMAVSGLKATATGVAYRINSSYEYNGDNYTVTAVANSAFEGRSDLKVIELPDTVRNIGFYAFRYCSSLVTFNVPASLNATEVDGAAINSTGFGEGVFIGCTRLTYFTSSDSGYYIVGEEDGVLYNMQTTALISYPAGKGSTVYSLPATTAVKVVLPYAFANANLLTQIDLSKGNNTIKGLFPGAFYGCNSLSSVIIENADYTTAVAGDEGVLYKKNGGVANELVYYPAALKQEEKTYYTIADTVTSVDVYAFDSNRYLTTITLGAGVGGVSYYAYRTDSATTSTGLYSLTKPPPIVSSMQVYKVFNNSVALTAIGVSGANTKFASDGGVLHNADKTYLYCCPSAKTGTYTTLATVTTIGTFAFQNTALMRVNIREEVKTINDNAFFNSGAAVYCERLANDPDVSTWPTDWTYGVTIS